MGAGATEPLLEPGQALDRLAAWKGRIDQLAADTRAMSERLGELRVTAADDNRMVEVTVDAQGALVDIRLGRRIQQVEPETVARTIMATMREARRKTADRAQEIITETLGTESPAARAMAAQVADRLRTAGAGEAGTRDRDGW
ncbi:YbaB/EbfC DNA-binding family protein [Pseudosporangium ferrugineum]|uniref:YbaB/EbfC DNA-binding family protein n=2 Tax=Pseudosporangium ferrugineum TaxID=439699 RepID=A0A2T0SIY6_9ACTN|nr:YbaB/EbfC DNA-binding family protein [Pseudosporangium ferrugineum]